MSKAKTKAELIKEWLSRARNEELPGQTSRPYYQKTLSTKIICELCDKQGCKLENNRIDPNGQFIPENVITTCKSCQSVIRRLYKETNASSEIEYRLAIVLAKIEVMDK